jgi:glutamyl-tRNA synthetase
MSTTSINFDIRILYARNKEIIDKISDRYFFVEDPFLIEVKEIPFKKIIAEPLLLPSNPEKGQRSINCNIEDGILRLYITSKDIKNLIDNNIIRLKDLFNIKISKIDEKSKEIKCTYYSKELNREYPIIHWVPEKQKIKVSIIKPDGSISSGYGEINLLDIPMKKTIQFERYGFINPIKLEKEKLYGYFTHY